MIRAVRLEHVDTTAAERADFLPYDLRLTTAGKDVTADYGGIVAAFGQHDRGVGIVPRHPVPKARAVEGFVRRQQERDWRTEADVPDADQLPLIPYRAAGIPLTQFFHVSW